jgi:putative transposase
MLNLYSFTMCLQSCLTATKIGKLFDILQGFLCVPSFTGGIRSLSRYTVQSERALSRLLCGTDFNWILIFALFFRYFLYKAGHVYLMSSDETVEGKAGNATFGLDKFYSSILEQPIKSVCLSCFSLLDVTVGKSYFMGFRQVVRTDADKARIAADKEHKKASKGKPSGRKKGTKNKPKGAELEEENASYRAFKAFFVCLIDTLRVIIPEFNLLYLVVDSAYGNQKYLKLAKEKGIFIISRLRKNPALWFNFEGPKGKTKPKKYGDKVDIFALNQKYFKYQYIENNIIYNVYQFQAWNKEMTDFLLNVVCVIAHNPNVKTKKAACFFSNDLNLSAENIIAYYKLRFQIEFNFRDTKEHFGLHKMKNYKQIQITNMFNLAFLSLLFAQILQQQWAIKLQKQNLSISDIKTIYKAQWTLKEAIKANQNSENPIFSPKFINNFVPKDIINAA